MKESKRSVSLEVDEHKWRGETVCDLPLAK